MVRVQQTTRVAGKHPPRKNLCSPSALPLNRDHMNESQSLQHKLSTQKTYSSNANTFAPFLILNQQTSII